MFKEVNEAIIVLGDKEKDKHTTLVITLKKFVGRSGRDGGGANVADIRDYFFIFMGGSIGGGMGDDGGFPCSARRGRGYGGGVQKPFG